MSDNVTLNSGSGGDTIAADDVGGAKYQRVKVCHGVDGTATDVSAASPLETAPTDPTATTGTLTAVDSASTSGTNAITQGYYTGTPTSGSHVDVALSGHNMVEFQVSGTASLTFACERSLDGGTTWYQAPFEALDGLLLTSQAISDNKPYGFRCNVGGCTNFRVRCTAYTSGTANVKIQPSFCLGQIWVRQGIANSIANNWPVKVTDGTNTMPTMDAVGRPGFVKVTDGTNVQPTGDAAARPIYTALTVQAAGGYTPGFALGASSDNATNVKNGAGTLGWIYVSNLNASVRYFKLYDKSSSPSSSDTPVLAIAIPGNTAGAGVSIPLPPQGLAFSSGIGYRLVTGQANNDNTSVTGTDHVINYGYK